MNAIFVQAKPYGEAVFSDKITPQWLLENIDIERAKTIYNESQASMPLNNVQEPYKGPHYAPGTWRMDPAQGSFEVLVAFNTWDVRPSEGEWNFAMMRKDTQLYIQWRKEGWMPPPCIAVRNIHSSNIILVSGRRRWLATIAACKATLPTWFSESGEHGGPAWKIPALGTYYQDRWENYPFTRDEMTDLDRELLPHIGA